MFFNNLLTEDTRVKSSIQDGLTMMCRAFENAPTEISAQIDNLLLENIEKVSFFLIFSL